MNFSKKTLDINCDLGEGMSNDALVMPYLDSCNIACGGHFGNMDSMKAAILLAEENQVNIGAHPSYPDRENFGRKSLTIDLEILEKSIVKQINDFEKACHALNVNMHHIKPHGALYNDLAEEEKLASFFLKLMQKHFPEMPLYCPPNSIIAKLAPKYNIKIILELFADRSYNDDLTLVTRTHPKALLTEIEQVKDHVYLMMNDKKIRTISGNMISVEAETLCVHGDNPFALEILKMIRSNFTF